jgi:hypothetical protein
VLQAYASTELDLLDRSGVDLGDRDLVRLYFSSLGDDGSGLR